MTLETPDVTDRAPKISATRRAQDLQVSIDPEARDHAMGFLSWDISWSYDPKDK